MSRIVAVPRLHRPERAVPALLGVLGLIMVLPALHRIDVAIAGLFYDPAANSWLMPKEGGLLHAILYTGTRRLLGIAGGLAILGLAISARRHGWSETHSRVAMALMVLALTPLSASLLKQFSGVSCPAQDALFGGTKAGATIWSTIFGHGPIDTHLRCWPAGHAAGGFGLFGLLLLGGGHGAAVALPRWLFYAPGMATGWIMGLYQMARGQHYLSHTLASMLIGLLIAASAYRLYEWQRKRVICATEETEPRRVCRRLQLLSRMEHHEQDDEQVFP